MNAKDFESYLKTVPNWSGRKLYFFECADGYVNYNEITHKFQWLEDSKCGYRPYSLSTIKELNSTQVSNIEDDIIKGNFMFTLYDMITRKREILINGFEAYKEN